MISMTITDDDYYNRCDIILYAGAEKVMKYTHAVVTRYQDYVVIKTLSGKIIRTNLNYLIVEK